MQFIENSELIQLENIINQLRVGSYYLSGRMEAFVSSYGSYSTHKRRHHSRRQPSTSNTASKTADTVTNRADGPEVDVAFANHSHVHPHLPTQGSIVTNEAFPVDPAAVSPIPVSTNRKPHPVTSVEMLKRPSRRRTSSLGDLSEPSSRALLLDFVTALNEAFPDHDFADSKIEQFKEIDTAEFMRSVNSCLAEVTMQVPGILERIWAALDELIDLHGCEVFSFIPDDSDDEACDNLWDFYYFLFNRDTDRLIYFSCSAKSTMRKMSSADDAMDGDDDDDEDMGDTGYADDSAFMDQSGMYGVPSVNSMMEDDGYDDPQAFDDEESTEEEQLPDW
jgi:hypothetical protein